MYGAILALLIALTMIVLVILKGRNLYSRTVFCKKAQLTSIIDTLSDDCVIQIWIGRNTYEHERAGNS